MKSVIIILLCLLLLSSIPTTWADSYGSGAYGSGPYGGSPPIQQAVSNEIGGAGGGCTINYTFTSSESVVGTAGSSVTVPVTVTNAGTCSGTVTVTATVPGGWSAGSGTTRLLGKNESDTVNITLRIPADGLSASITFIAVAGRKTYTFSTAVNIASSAEEPAPTRNPLPSPGAKASRENETGVGFPYTADFWIIILALSILAILAVLGALHYYSRYRAPY